MRQGRTVISSTWIWTPGAPCIPVGERSKVTFSERRSGPIVHRKEWKNKLGFYMREDMNDRWACRLELEWLR